MEAIDVSMDSGILGDDIGPEMVMHWYSADANCRGVVVLDTMSLGRAAGGTRMLTDITTAEMIALARAMTYKSVTLGRTGGGAKAGIWANPSMDVAQREAVMRAYGKAIRPLVQANKFSAGADMGTFHKDLLWVEEESGQSVPMSKFWLEDKDGEALDYHFTGFGVAVCAQAACEFRGIDFRDATVAMEGFGKVGSGLARYAAADGAKLVAVSTLSGAIFKPTGLDTEKLLRLRREHGDDLVHHYDDAETIDPAKLFSLPVDILVPGGRPWVIHDGNVDNVSAKIISSGANVPITASAEEKLHHAGVTIVPDFIANSAGALSTHLGRVEVSIDQAFPTIRSILQTRVSELLRTANADGLIPSHLAMRRVHETVKRWKENGPPVEKEYYDGLRKAAAAA